MITKEQLKMIEVFRKGLFKKFTFNELKKQLKEASNSKLQRAISDFENEGLIILERVGKTNLISLNFGSIKLFDYLSLSGMEFAEENFPLKAISSAKDSILPETEFFSLIVFGSYANGTQKKDSDLDIAIIVENSDIKSKITTRINSVKRKSLIEMDIHVFTRMEFLEMLREDRENLGKEIARNSVVVYGAINFYNLILKEVKNAAFI